MIAAGPCMIALPPAKPPQSADDSRTEQTMPDRILIIEDEPAIADALVYALGTEGFDVHWCALAGDGMQWLRDNPVDLLVLDVGLPDESGFEVCRRIRQFSALPIMFLTARKEEVDRIVGLEIGADDYVVKPFQFEELEARLNALLRRSSGFTQASIEAGPLKLDLNRKQAMVNDEPLPLTAFEYRILEYLMRHQQQVVAKERLMEQLYPDDNERDANVIEVLVGRLRRKLDAHGGLKPIDTVRGLGYLFTERCR